MPAAARDGALVQPDWNVRLAGEMCWVRRTGGQVHRIIVGNARSFSLGASTFDLGQATPFAEFTAHHGNLERVR